jgi:hypothetical protein
VEMLENETESNSNVKCLCGVEYWIRGRLESIVFGHPRVEVSRPRVEVGLLVLVFGLVAPRS